MPLAFIMRTASKTDLSTLGDSPMDGSSSMTSAGSSIRPRAISTSRCCPPERLPAFIPAQSAIWGNISSTCARRLASSARLASV